jgi:hypothetical protein
LQELEVLDPLMPRLQGIHRKTWFTNQLQLSLLRDALEALDRAGIATMVIRDASVSLRLYPEPGVRPVTDVELLIPMALAVRATRVLERSGWRSDARKARVEVAVASNRGLPLRRLIRPGVIALRARLGTPHAVAAGAAIDEQLWRDAVELEVEGVPTTAPSLADELLQICVEGASGRGWRAIQWVADATMILRRGDDLDWPRLVRSAQRAGVTLPLIDAFLYLGRLLDAPVPPVLVEELRNSPVTRRELLAYRIGSRGGRFSGALPSLVGQYVRATRGQHPVRSIARFPRFLQSEWGADHWWQIPSLAVGAVVERFRPRRRQLRRS